MSVCRANNFKSFAFCRGVARVCGARGKKKNGAPYFCVGIFLPKVTSKKDKNQKTKTNKQGFHIISGTFFNAQIHLTVGPIMDMSLGLDL